MSARHAQQLIDAVERDGPVDAEAEIAAVLDHIGDDWRAAQRALAMSIYQAWTSSPLLHLPLVEGTPLANPVLITLDIDGELSVDAIGRLH